jgi:hypothetical protein
MLKPLRNAPLTASSEPDREAKSCQWRDGALKPVRRTRVETNAPDAQRLPAMDARHRLTWLDQASRNADYLSPIGDFNNAAADGVADNPIPDY